MKKKGAIQIMMKYFFGNIFSFAKYRCTRLYLFTLNLFNFEKLFDDFRLFMYFAHHKFLFFISKAYLIIFRFFYKIKNFKKKSKNNTFVLVLFNIINLVIIVLNLIKNFIGFIVFAVWVFVVTLILHFWGYVRFAFDIGWFYNTRFDATPEQIWTIISKFLNIKKKKYFNLNYFLFSLKMFLFYFKKTIKRLRNTFHFIVEVTLFKFIKGKEILYAFSFLWVYLEIIDFFFYKNLLYKFSILNYFFLNLKKKKFLFKIYLFRKTLWPILKNFRRTKNKIFVLPFKKRFKKFKRFLKSIFLKKNRRKIKKIFKKMKKSLLEVQNLIGYNYYKNKTVFTQKTYSTEKRFLYLYLKLLKKGKDVHYGVLRLIYIKNLWIYSFSLKSYSISIISNLYYFVKNLVDVEMVILALKIIISMSF